MTPTPTRPEPTTPTREELLRICQWLIDQRSHLDNFDNYAVIVARALKQRLTSEPAGPTVLKEVYFAKGPITDEDKAEWERAAKHAQPIDLEVLDAKLMEPEPVASVPVTRDALVKHFKSRIQPPFAAPETLAQEGFLERFEARAQKKAEDDADAILALIGAKQP